MIQQTITLDGSNTMKIDTHPNAPIIINWRKGGKANTDTNKMAHVSLGSLDSGGALEVRRQLSEALCDGKEFYVASHPEFVDVLRETPDLDRDDMRHDLIDMGDHPAMIHIAAAYELAIYWD